MKEKTMRQNVVSLEPEALAAVRKYARNRCNGDVDKAANILILNAAVNLGLQGDVHKVNGKKFHEVPTETISQNNGGLAESVDSAKM
jgi:hypothetical protein